MIRNEDLWHHWEKRSSILTDAGIPTEVVDRKALEIAEPQLNTAGLIGAVYTREGMLNPLKVLPGVCLCSTKNGCQNSREHQGNRIASR